jgi:Bacterial TSP3 repeat
MKTIIATSIFVAAIALTARGATTINPTNSFAYGANIGWLNWRGDVANGAVVGEYVCSGSIWSANVGWISLGNGTPTNGIQYGNASATDFGVNLTGHYISAGVPRAQLRGFAYGANIGWINFESLGNPEVSLSTGKLSGFAYSANCGWIDLANATAFVQTDVIVPGADTDGDGIADAYEFLYTTPDTLTVLTATGDADGDGATDRAEYLADTNPLDPAGSLRITGYVRAADQLSLALTWTTQPTRLYRIEDTTNMQNGFTLALDAILPDAGATTTRNTTTVAGELRRFFRVQAYRPLGQ